MFLHQAELDQSLLFYMGATVLYGGTIFYRAKKNRVEKAPPFRWGLLLLLTLEVLCFTTLRNSLGLGLFSLACLVFWLYTPAQAVLPISHKAVLITGKEDGMSKDGLAVPPSRVEWPSWNRRSLLSKNFSRELGFSLASVFSFMKVD